MKSLLIPLFLTALISIVPAAICDDLPTAPPRELVQISPLDVVFAASDLELVAIVEFDTESPAMRKNIIAKLNCISVLGTEGQEQVTFQAVTGDSEENKSFSKYTPSASLEMCITNPAAIGVFEPGRDYLVTITAADDVTEPG